MSQTRATSGAAEVRRRGPRSDARRNHERILAAARTAIARHGAEASLEEIARQAGIGSATLHRHFPTRTALLQAVFHDRVDALCEQARELADAPDPGAALVTWLRAVGTYAASTRGLGAALLREASRDEAPGAASCQDMLAAAGGLLLERACRGGAARPQVSIADLLTVVSAVALATEHTADGAREADRLVALALDGIHPARPSGPGT